MQIVIDINDKEYEEIMDNKLNKSWDMTHYERVIANGMPLPKGHGRLIDADKTISKICGSSCGCHLEECGQDKPCFSVTRIESAPTIIEADVPKRRKGIPLEENDSGYNCENWIP